VSAEIRELNEVEDLRELAALFSAIWGRPHEPAISSDILKALAHSGNYVAGAYAGGELIGGLVGWLGGVPPHDEGAPANSRRSLGVRGVELHLHSHILGVLPGHDARGLGFELKQHQRRWCLEREVRVMEWTTDPLVRRNAYFNLTKLGARAPRYLVDFYGEMSDGINAGEESDRLLIRWDLDSPRAEEAAADRAVEPDVDKLRAGGAVAILIVAPSGEPVAERASSDTLLCQVPGDIVALRRSNPALARAWRHALRTALREAMAAGHRITGATRTGWYVLESGAE